MRKLLLLALALALLAGCNKLRLKGSKSAAPAPQQAGGGDQPGVHAPTGVVVNPGLGGGGSGGAVQAVRMRVKRAVSENDLNNIRLYMENASAASGRLPPAEEVTAAIQREAPAIYKLIQEKAIILTGTRSRENIWAYTAEPQNASGQHVVIAAGNIELKDGQVLRQRLQMQGQ